MSCMEGNEISILSSLFRLEIMKLSNDNHPLFSCIVTLYALIILYFPQFLTLFFSPVPILTALLLLFLLRIGSSQNDQTEIQDQNGTQKKLQTEENVQNYEVLIREDKWVGSGFDIKSDYEESFIEWNLKAPLEVIYEAYEGEDKDDDDNENVRGVFPGLERYPSLSMYYPETDSDSDSSDGGFSVTGERDSPESVCFKWEAEEDRDGLLIEIALDHNNPKKFTGLDSGLDMDTDMDLDFHVEEDNLIEIDITPPRNDAVFR